MSATNNNNGSPAPLGILAFLAQKDTTKKHVPFPQVQTVERVNMEFLKSVILASTLKANAEKAKRMTRKAVLPVVPQKSHADAEIRHSM